jgi:hypothetical protein
MRRLGWRAHVPEQVRKIGIELALTTGFTGFAESEMLSAQGRFPSAEPVPRGSSRHSALGTAWPAKSSLPRARSRTHGTWVP